MTNLAIVTGASRGIGYEVAVGLARRGWNLHLVSANQSRIESAARAISADYPTSEVSTSAIDFADLDAIRSALSLLPNNWDLLVNNAGVKVVEGAGLTVQGFEWHLGINQLAPFALTLGLLPMANRGARITTVSSIVARTSAPTDLFGPFKRVSDNYAASKLVNLAFAYELNLKLRHSANDLFQSMCSNAAHPGFTRASKYGKSYVRPAEYLFAQNVRLGAKPILDAATEPLGSFDAFSYLGPKHFELWGGASPAKLPPRLEDEKLRRDVWRHCEELAGLSADFLS